MASEANRNLNTEELFRLYAPFVARFLYRLGVGSDALDDAVQDVFLVAHRNGGYRAGPAKPTSYLATIAMNAASAHRRRERKRRARHAEVEVEALLAKGKTPVQLLESSDSMRLLESVLERLEPEQKSLLVLVEIEGESCTSIAAAMGIPVGTVYFRLHQARKKFQAAFRIAEAARPRLVPRDAPAPEARRAKLAGVVAAELLWQRSEAHAILRGAYETPPLSYETLAGLERHRQIAASAMPLPPWATAPAAPAGAALGAGAGTIAALGAAAAAAIWLAAGAPAGASAPDMPALPAVAARETASAVAPPTAPEPAPPATEPTPNAPPATATTLTAASSGVTPGTTADTPSPSARAAAEPARTEPARTDPARTEPARAAATAVADRIAAAPAASAAPPSEGDDGRLESLQIAQAERLLRGDPARALAAVRSARERFPAGYLREERSYIEIAALSKLGRTSEARAAGAAFLRSYPNGAFAKRVRALLEP